jgi:uncharacterized protein (DUF849 family)
VSGGAPLLQAALNGAREPGAHPALPITADELAADAALALVAGAAGVHVHPRDELGRQTLAPGACGEAVAAIRAAAGEIEVSLSTGAFIEPSVQARVDCIAGWTVVPDVASVNWWEDGALELSRALAHRGVQVEAGISSIPDARAFLASRTAPLCRRVLVEIDDERLEPAAAVERAAAVDAVLAEGLLVLPRLHHGAGVATWAVIVAAARAGRSVRIGLEDTLVAPDGRTASGNAAMVAAARELLRRALH